MISPLAGCGRREMSNRCAAPFGRSDQYASIPKIMTSRQLEDEDYCYLVTTGRVTGHPREIEIWFALQGRTLYMLAGGGDRAQWVQNIQRQPSVSVRIGTRRFDGTARIVAEAEEDQRARRLLVEKYEPRDRSDLTEWGRTSLPVAVDLVFAVDGPT
jgi:deazaflavin-dependent oxidoreductase (nitroreductase family)